MFFAIINLHIDHLTIGRWTATWVLPGDARIWSFLGHPGQEFLLDFLLEARVKDSLPGQGWILLLHRGKNNHGTDNLTHPFKKRPPQMGLFFSHLFGTLYCIRRMGKKQMYNKMNNCAGCYKGPFWWLFLLRFVWIPKINYKSVKSIRAPSFRRTKNNSCFCTDDICVTT